MCMNNVHEWSSTPFHCYSAQVCATQQQQQQQQLAVRRNTQDTPWNVSTCGQKRHTSLAWASHLFIMIYSAWALAVRKDTFEHFHFLMSYKFSTSARRKVLWTPQVLKILTSKCAFRHSRVHFFNMYKTFSLPNVLFASAACKFSTSARPKVLWTPHVLKILTSKCAFRHSRVHFFNISTYKSGPNTSCFVDFDFKMYVSPQWRTIFRHLNFEKCSRTLSFLTFSLPNVLFATAARNFWFIRWPPDSAPAALTGLLFDWPDTRIIEKTQHFVTSLTFSADVSSFTWLWHYCIFCRLTWRLYCWAMHLVFNSPYCRKFLFKLPSIITKSKHSRSPGQQKVWWILLHRPWCTQI